MSISRLIIVTSALLSSLWAASAHAQFKPPENGVLTEKQVVSYVQILKDAMDNLKAAGKAIDGNTSGAAAMAVYLNNDAKFKASLAAHGMTQEEYTWVGSKVADAWGSLLIEQTVANAQKALAEQRMTNQQKVNDAKTKLAIYQKAQAEGRRIMTQEERDNAIQSAKADQQSATDEAKQHADDLKQAQEDRAKAQADAKAADALAKNPPADVSADDRPGFIDQKKAEAQQALDAAKEAMEKAAEATKARDEALANAARAGAKAAHPDVPVTDDEKTEVKKNNDDQITALNNDITEGEQGLKLLDESAQTFAKTMQDQQAKNAVPPQNVDLLRKHRSEYETIWGVKMDNN